MLRDNYRDGDIGVIAERLGRSRAEVYCKARSLGIRRKSVWTVDEISRLEELFPDNDIASIAAIIGRSESSVKMEAYKLGLRRKRRGAA